MIVVKYQHLCYNWRLFATSVSLFFILFPPPLCIGNNVMTWKYQRGITETSIDYFK